MTATSDSDDRTLPAASAERLLARAAALDAASRDAMSVADLRAAATEAGISVQGFDAALEELRGSEAAEVHAVARWRRPPRRWAVAGALTALVAIGALAISLARSPGGVIPPGPTSMVEEAFALRCLSAGDAAALIRPLIRARDARIVVSPERAPHVLTVRGSPQQLQRVREVLARNDDVGSPACGVARSGQAVEAR